MPKKKMENKFIEFLCRNKAYRQFMHNLAYIEKGKYGWENYSYTTYYEYWIVEAFEWDLSPERHKFWQNLNIKWLKEL